jgi:hypothetical protein
VQESAERKADRQHPERGNRLPAIIVAGEVPQEERDADRQDESEKDPLCLGLMLPGELVVDVFRLRHPGRVTPV